MILNDMYSFEQTIRVSFDVVSLEYSTFCICPQYSQKVRQDWTISQ